MTRNKKRMPTVTGPTMITRRFVIDAAKLVPPHRLDRPMAMRTTAPATMESAGRESRDEGARRDTSDSFRDVSSGATSVASRGEMMTDDIVASSFLVYALEPDSATTTTDRRRGRGLTGGLHQHDVDPLAPSVGDVALYLSERRVPREPEEGLPAVGDLKTTGDLHGPELGDTDPGAGRGVRDSLWQQDFDPELVARDRAGLRVRIQGVERLAVGEDGADFGALEARDDDALGVAVLGARRTRHAEGGGQAAGDEERGRDSRLGVPVRFEVVRCLRHFVSLLVNSGVDLRLMMRNAWNADRRIIAISRTYFLALYYGRSARADHFGATSAPQSLVADGSLHPAAHVGYVANVAWASTVPCSFTMRADRTSLPDALMGAIQEP